MQKNCTPAEHTEESGTNPMMKKRGAEQTEDAGANKIPRSRAAGDGHSAKATQTRSKKRIIVDSPERVRKKPIPIAHMDHQSAIPESLDDLLCNTPPTKPRPHSRLVRRDSLSIPYEADHGSLTLVTSKPSLATPGFPHGVGFHHAKERPRDHLTQPP